RSSFRRTPSSACRSCWSPWPYTRGRGDSRRRSKRKRRSSQQLVLNEGIALHTHGARAALRARKAEERRIAVHQREKAARLEPHIEVLRHRQFQARAQRNRKARVIPTSAGLRGEPREP